MEIIKFCCHRELGGRMKENLAKGLKFVPSMLLTCQPIKIETTFPTLISRLFCYEYLTFEDGNYNVLSGKVPSRKLTVCY